MVIQRIQTLYLILAILAIAIFAFIPTLTFDCEVMSHVVTVFRSKIDCKGTLDTSVFPNLSETNHILVTLFALIEILLVITIFKFKDLSKQILLCKISIALMLAFSASYIIKLYFTSSSINSLNSIAPLLSITMSPISYNYFAWVLMLAAVILCVLALRGMKADKALLSSADRLR